MINVGKYTAAAFLAAVLFSCGDDTPPPPPLTRLLAGNWITKSYSDSMTDLRSIRKFKEDALELVFRESSDSFFVMVVGLESYTLRYDSIGPRTIRVEKFNQDDYTDLSLNEDGSVLSYEYKKFKTNHAFTWIPEMFVKEKMNNGWTAGSTWFINHSLLAGEYEMLGGKEHQHLSINANGTIQGWMFSNYAICTGGDCASMFGGDLVTLTDSTGSKDLHWTFKGDTLELYKLKQVNAPDEFPELQPDGLFVKLLKEN